METSGVTFQECGLDGAHIYRADLKGVSFINSYLERIVMHDCNLQGVSFERADLDGGDLSGSNLCFVNLNRTNMRGVILNRAKGIYEFGPIGDFERTCYAVDWGDKIMFQIDYYFWGTEEEAVAKIGEKYGEDSSYVRQIRLAAEILREKR